MSSCPWLSSERISGGRNVTAYRVYVLNEAGRVGAPPHVIECDEDEEAIRQARQYLDGRAIEIWRESIIIARLEPT
jgi:hypothetical protein